jgi:hypothetical protein
MWHLVYILVRFSQIYKKTDRFFARNEYLFADAGYGLSENIVPVFKKPRRGQLTRDQTAFNMEQKRIRVRSEICIGHIKNRWMSLKGIRAYLTSSEDHDKICRHIMACLVLYNLSRTERDVEDEEGEVNQENVVSDDDDDEELPILENQLVGHQADRRTRLLNFMIEQ